MSEILFTVALLLINVVSILMVRLIKRLYKEIDEEICEIKEKLEFHRIKLEYIQSCELDNEKKIDQLEKLLDLKEWLDKN